jgi:SulP family sulfate permease
MTAVTDPAHVPFLLRVVPALEVLRRYGLRDLRADVLAGLTVATVAVPQAMAYALVAGVPAEYGLYTAIVMTAVGAVLDSSRQLINGPTNATSIAALSATAFVVGEQEKIQAIILLAFLVGASQLAITLLRLGDLTRYISHSVIVGFTLGAGTLLVLEQLKNLLGLKAVGDVHDPFVFRFFRTMTEGGDVHTGTVAVGLGVMASVVALRWVKGKLGLPLLPELLLVVVGVSWLSMTLDFKAAGVAIVGPIPAGLPSFASPTFDLGLIHELLPSAVAIALLGLLEALAMAKAIASQTGQKLDLNQQCLSEGLANFTGSFFQCIPGSGSLTRSAINQAAGASSQWSGVISALGVLGIAWVFAPWAQYLPKSALSGILILSAWRMVDKHALMFHLRATKFDRIIVAATAFSAVFISIEFCVMIGVLLSFLLAVPRAGRMLLTEFVVAPDGHVEERHDDDARDPRMLMFGLEGEMFFGATNALERHLETIEDAVTPETRVIVLRMKRARSPDAVGAHLLEGFLRRVEVRGVTVLLCGVRADLDRILTRTGVRRALGDDHVFVEQRVRQTSTSMAVRFAQQLLGEPEGHARYRHG